MSLEFLNWMGSCAFISEKCIVFILLLKFAEFTLRMPKNNYYDLKPIFDSEDACIEYLYEHKAIYNTMKCPTHSMNMVKTKKIWRCRKHSCTKRISIFKDFLLKVI